MRFRSYEEAQARQRRDDLDRGAIVAQLRELSRRNNKRRAVDVGDGHGLNDDEDEGIVTNYVQLASWRRFMLGRILHVRCLADNLPSRVAKVPCCVGRCYGVSVSVVSAAWRRRGQL